MAALVRGKYEKSYLKKAVNNNSMSQRQAAFGFEVPKSSLNDMLHEKHSSKNGWDTLLSSTCEMLLVTIILFMADIGFEMTKLLIKD